MSDKNYSKICNEEDKDFLSSTKIITPENNIIIANFGKDYKNKVNSSKSIKDFYNLKEVKEDVLFNLQPRGGDVIDDLFNGKYRAYLEKRIGTKIINYNGFVINNFSFHSKNCLNLVKKNSTNIYINNIKRVVSRVEKLRTEELKLQCKGFRFGRKQEISRASKFLTLLSQSQQDTFDSEIKSHELTKIIKFVESHEIFLDLFKQYNLKEIYKINNALLDVEADNAMHIGHIEVQINNLVSIHGVENIIKKISELHTESKNVLLNEKAIVAPLFKNINIKNINIKELVKTSELTHEGQVMNHCVGGYSYSIRDGASRILSFANNNVRGTLQLSKRRSVNDKYRCQQFLSYNNSEPPKEMWEALYLFSLNFEPYMDLEEIIKTVSKKINHNLILSLCEENNPELYDDVEAIIEYITTGKKKVVEKPVSCIYESFLDEEFF
jgi:hypothetical protein